MYILLYTPTFVRGSVMHIFNDIFPKKSKQKKQLHVSIPETPPAL